MPNEICPKCGRKSLRYRKMVNDYICDRYQCKTRFDENKQEYRIKDANKDEYGNYFKGELKKEQGKIIQITTYFLEEGKTTLRGQYPKLKNASNCVFPERLSCNYGTGFERCKFMKYGGSIGNWKCVYKQTNNLL